MENENIYILYYGKIYNKIYYLLLDRVALSLQENSFIRRKKRECEERAYGSIRFS